MSLTYAIADLHGRYDLLRAALNDIADHAGSYIFKLVVLGDFVDRGPQSREIVSCLRSRPDAVVLQGNHEDMMLQAIAAGNNYMLRWWFGNGGGQTLQSYGYEQGDPLKPLKPGLLDDCRWLANLPVWYEDEHRIYVHAGVPHDKTLHQTPTQTLQWMLYRDGGPQYRDADYADDLPHMSGKHVVHGHHQSADHPLLKPHRTNLDSFAWHTGRLAIGVFDDAIPGGPVEILEVFA